MAKPEAAERPVDAAQWRRAIHRVIFEADTRAGLVFDTALLVCIALSVGVVLLASVPWIHDAHHGPLLAIEWGFTLLFTFEYALRLASVRRPARYATSFFGIVDLLAILPTWASLAFAGTESLMVVRILRLLRVFRVFRLAVYVKESNVLAAALLRSRRKVGIFLGAVLMLVTILGALLYVVEGPEHGFTSIPESMYWAIVTLTTVGYGDISPQTPWGKAIASLAMVTGYAIIAVPTGIVSAELVDANRAGVSRRACPACGAEGHPLGAAFCYSCAAPLNHEEG